MVRKMAELKLIEDELSRQLSFAKRRNGLIKKGLELCRVCGVDCLFISFSPSGRLSFFSGEKRIEDILARFATVPEHLRKFNLSDLQQLLAILRELKEQTEAHVANDRDKLRILDKDRKRNCSILGVQQEITQVKEEIQRAKLEIRRYQPLSNSIMTVSEANSAECFLEEALAKVHERKKVLITANDDANVGEYLPSDSMVGEENGAKIPETEKLLDEQPNEDDSNNNQIDEEIMANQSPPTEGEMARIMANNDAPASLLFEMASPSPYQGGSNCTSFTNLLLGEDLPDGTFSPILTDNLPEVPEQDNVNGSVQQNQFSVFKDGLLNTQLYSNDNGSSSGQNGGAYEATSSNNMFNFPMSNLISNDFGALESSLNIPQQIQPQIQSSNPNFDPLSLSFMSNGGGRRQIMPIGGGATNSSSLFPALQWNNQNLTPLGEGNGFQNLLYSVAGANNMYSDVRSRAEAFPNPTNLLMNHQPMGGHIVDHNTPMNLQGTLANFVSVSQGNQIPAAPAGHLEGGELTSSSLKRKFPWEPNHQNEDAQPNATPNADLVPPREGEKRNLAYNTAFEVVGLPIDPHFRMYQEMYSKNKSGNSKEQEDTNNK